MTEVDGPDVAVRTFLMTDIEGSTPMWDRYATLMDDVLQQHDALIAAAVEAEGGTLVRTKGEGDSTFSVFDDALGAARAALVAQRDLALARWPGGVRVRVRMGIHGGETVRRDGDWFGTHVNRAARIRGLARGGEIVVSAEVASTVRDRLPPGAQLLAVGRHQLRGLAQAEQAFALIDPDARPPELEANPPVPGLLRPDGIFVGRELEMIDVLSHIDKVADEGGAVLVSGPAGSGKTALVSQVVSTKHGEGALVLAGRARADAPVPYGPLAEAVRDHVGSLPASRQPHLAPEAMDRVRVVIPDLTGDGVGGDLPQVDPTTDRELTFDAVHDYLEELARPHPTTLLVVEDAHWADAATIQLAQHLLAHPVPGVVLVLVDRDGEPAGLRTLHLALRGLDPADATSLVRAKVFLAGPATPALEGAREHEAVTSLLAITDGLPLHLLQLLEAVPSLTAIPSRSVLDLVTTKLGVVSPQARAVVEVAAILGSSITRRDLGRLVEVEDLLAVLDELTAADVLVETTPGSYRFSHDTVRTAVLTATDRPTRWRLHLRAAEALAETAPVSAVLHHLLEAAGAGPVDEALAVQAATLARQVAEEALRRVAPAAADIERTVGLLGELLPAGARAGLLLTLGAARHAEGDVTGERDAVRSAAPLALAAAEPVLLMDTAVALALHGTIGVPDEVTTEFCRAALQLVGTEDLVARSRILSSLAFHEALYAGKPSRAIELVDEALELARSSGDDIALANALSTSAAARVGAPDAEHQLELGRELRDVASRRADPVLAARALRVEGPVQLQLANRRAFDDARRRQHDLADHYRHWFWAALALQWDVMALMLDGRFDDAERDGVQLLTYGHHDPDVVNVYGAQLLLIREGQGRLEEMLPLAVAALAQNPGLAAFRVALAAAYAELGRPEEAAAYFDHFAAGGFANVPTDVSRSGCLALLAQSCASVGSPTDAVRLHEALLPYSGQLIVLAAGISCLGAADRFLGILDAHRGDVPAALARFERAADLEEAAASPALWTRTRFWWGRTLLLSEPVRRAEAHDVLQSARTSAVALGMQGVVTAVDALVR